MMFRSLPQSKTFLGCLCLLCALWLPQVTAQAGEAGDEGTADQGEVESATFENVPGTVTQVGNFGFGLVPDADPGTRYAPTEPLPEEFQVDGLRVRFSGKVGDADESAGRGGGRGSRRWGTPLEVTHIERLDAP